MSITDDDWTPPPGAVKRECLQCHLQFASREDATICPICLAGQGNNKRTSTRRTR